MIYLVDENRLGDLTAFCGNTPLALKIFSLYQCYGLHMSFLDFWLQYNENKNISAILMKFENAITVVGSAQSDIEEITAFVSTIGFHTLNTNLSLNLDFCTVSRAVVMEHKGENRQPSDCFEYQFSASLHQAYDIMKSCENHADFEVPPFDGFYADMSHRMRHGGGECVIAFHKGKAVSCALATAITEKAVLLGIVACRPEYRRLGLGGAAVQALLSHFSDKSVLTFRDENNNQAFYQKQNFVEKQIVYIYKLKE